MVSTRRVGRGGEASLHRALKGAETAAPVRGASPPAAPERPRSALERKNAEAAAQASANAGARRLGATSPLFLGATDPARLTAAEAWAEVGRALAALPPAPRGALPEGLEAALKKHGFAKGRGEGAFRRGPHRLAARAFALGGETAVALKLEGPSAKGKAKTKEAVLFGGALIPAELFARLEARFDLELERFARAVKATRGQELPADLSALKTFMGAGLTPAERASSAEKEQAIEAALAKITARLETMQAQGTAPKGIIVYAEGPDAAGKSSTGGIVMDAFEAGGYRLRGEVFKAPTAEERQQHWLQRFERGVPRAGEAVFWDRGPAGDTVYGPIDDPSCARMAKEFTAFEANLRERGVLLLKIELHAAPEKQAETLGKRLGRQYVAERIGAALEARGLLGDDERRGLAEIDGKLDLADFKALVSYDEVQARYLRFVDQTEREGPWLLTDATKRHDARMGLIRGVEKALEAWGR